MGEGAWLVAFLVVQRLVELGFAQFNTGRLRARGGVEFGAMHYPLLIALHASWLVGLWLLGHDQHIVYILARGLRASADGPIVGDREPRPAMDYPRHRAARRRSGWTISLA